MIADRDRGWPNEDVLKDVEERIYFASFVTCDSDVSRGEDGMLIGGMFG